MTLTAGLLAVLTVMTPSTAHSAQPVRGGPLTGEGRDGNGGGGIYRDGRYLTFGSAKVELGDVKISNTPGLSLLLEAIHSMPLSDKDRGTLVLAAEPMGKRKFFQAKSGSIPAKDIQELQKIYADIAYGVAPADTIRIFAVTQGHETFLLPEFFALEPIQQAAILFHEMLWVINPALSYRDVINAEMRFESYLKRDAERGFDFEVMDSLSLALNAPSLPVTSAAVSDLAAGRLRPWLTRQGRLSVGKVFGRSLTTTATFDNHGKYFEVELRLDSTLLAGHLAKLRTKHPDTLLFSALLSCLQEGLLTTIARDGLYKIRPNRAIVLAAGRPNQLESWLNEALAQGDFGIKLWETETTNENVRSGNEFSLIPEALNMSDIFVNNSKSSSIALLFERPKL